MTDTKTRSDFDTVVDLLTRGGFTEDALLKIAHLASAEIKEARARDSRRAIARLNSGDTVRVLPGLLSTRRFDNRTFDVVKINRTRIVLDVEGVRTTVPANVVEKVA
jgi:hypothetical protein